MAPAPHDPEANQMATTELERAREQMIEIATRIFQGIASGKWVDVISESHDLEMLASHVARIEARERRGDQDR